jgi:hypothetical protein
LPLSAIAPNAMEVRFFLDNIHDLFYDIRIFGSVNSLTSRYHPAGQGSDLMKLHCFALNSDPPKIAPARASRQWMDDFPDSHVYFNRRTII